MRRFELKPAYLAAVAGRPEPLAGLVDLPIARRGGGSLLREIRPDGRRAETGYRCLASKGDISLLELHPRTGRTHQLRVHCAALGCPILGDRDYGDSRSLSLSAALDIHTQQLCAARLTLPHPLTGQRVTIVSRQAPIFPDCGKILAQNG